MPKQNPKKSICLYFQLHQPYRLEECSFFARPGSVDHFRGPERFRNRAVFEKVAQKCYLPATKMFAELLEKHPELRLSFSLSGVFLEQCEEFPEYGTPLLKLFKKLVATGRVELLAETYFHSLAFLYSKEEFAEQIALHSAKVRKLFGITPQVFRNTELIYSNELGEFIRRCGFQGMLSEGWDPYLGSRSPNFLYRARPTEIHAAEKIIAKSFRVQRSTKKVLPLLLKNYQLSDDIAFRFGNKEWPEYPLTAEKFVSWVQAAPGETVNLFMDYETIGEHTWKDTGIFDFFRALPAALLKGGIGFHTPSEAIKNLKPKEEYDVPNYLSWADTERDLSAWLENDIQRSALTELAKMEQLLHPWKYVRSAEIQNLLHQFRRLQTSDHLYYMSTKYWSDGDVHKYFSAYTSPYEAYINFMNTLRMLKRQFTGIITHYSERSSRKKSSVLLRSTQK